MSTVTSFLANRRQILEDENNTYADGISKDLAVNLLSSQAIPSPHVAGLAGHADVGVRTWQLLG